MAIALVSGSKNRNDDAWGNTYRSSVSCAFAANVSAGNLLVALIDHGDGSSNSLSSVTDSLGQTWTKAVEYWNATLRQGIAIYCKYNTAGGSNTVSANFSGSSANWITLQVCEFSGVLSTGDPLDKTASGGVANSGMPSIGPITPGQDGELIVAMCGDIDGDSTSLAIASPFGEIGRLSAADTSGYYLQPASAAISAGFTGNATIVAANLCMVSFKPATGGGTTYNRSVTSSFPAPAGATSRNGAFGEVVAGTCPAPAGAPAKQTGKMLAGSVPAAAGLAVRQTTKALSGTMPAASGNAGHAAILHQAVSGVMGTITGAISALVNPVVAAAMGLHKIIGSGLKKIIGG